MTDGDSIRLPTRQIAWGDPRTSLTSWLTRHHTRPVVYLTLGTVGWGRLSPHSRALDADDRTAGRRMTPTGALGRSWALTRGSRWRMLGLLVNLVFRAIERRSLSWHQSVRGEEVL